MADQSRDPWRRVWRVANSNSVLVVLLLAMAVGVTLTAWIPQEPSAGVAYARWLSQMQARFGEVTPAMRALGLFNIVSSLAFRVLLALLSGCLFLRLVERVDRLRQNRETEEPDRAWREISRQELTPLLQALRRRRYRVVNASSWFQVDRWPWSETLSVMVHLGGLLLLIGLLLSHLLGWRIDGVVVQEGERRPLQGADAWVMLTEDGSETRHSPGVVTFIEERGPGVHVSAIDGDGDSLGLLVSPEADPRAELTIALTEDTYFAIPEAELMIRLSPRSPDAYARVEVQVYGSPTGEVISERLTDKGGHIAFTVEDVSLTFLSAPYARVLATHNPGWVPAGLGLTMLMVGTVGSLVWPERRFWLRGEESSIEAVGSLPSWLQVEEEDR